MPCFSFSTQAWSAYNETGTVLRSGNPGTARPRAWRCEGVSGTKTALYLRYGWGSTKGAIHSLWVPMGQQSLLVGLMLEISLKRDRAYPQLRMHHHLPAWAQEWGIQLIPTELDHLRLLDLGLCLVTPDDTLQYGLLNGAMGSGIRRLKFYTLFFHPFPPSPL